MNLRPRAVRFGPPARAVALLARRLEDCAWRESILGDLDEEHAAITRRRSRLAADLWYWRQVVIGVYALVGYYVAQRRQEIGVRMALGVVRQTVRQAATMAGVGVAIGAAAAFGISRMLESSMMGIAQNDPRLLAAFATILTLSALVAGYVPARRAAGIDPMAAIRNE